MVSFDDIDERRNADLSLRPRSKEILIRADADSPYRAGLVLDRPSDGLEIPNVSGTSLAPTASRVFPNANELWHALWLARQEIMLLEGRRLADLGIKLPMMLREIDQNDNINEGDPGTTPVVPGIHPAEPAVRHGHLLSARSVRRAWIPGSPLVETMVTMGMWT